MSYRVVCLLPARNSAQDLIGFFDSARRYCDAVVALDDGSTDESADLLAVEPLVQILLRNPRREDYRGWDDAANRNRLLDAAAALEPEWIISIDADERVDQGDALALRSFVEMDALPGFAYGFRHVPMQDDEEHFLPQYQWVYRLFAYQPGLQFPSKRLHFPPVPTAIPRSRWMRTSLRIQHLGGMTEDRRSVRFRKYLESDPDREYQAEYGHLVRTPNPRDLRRWQPRPPDLPVLIGPEPETSENGAFLPTRDFPAISVIVIAQNDEATIARPVAAVVAQDCPEPFEVIVVASGSDRTADIVRDQFPSVTLVVLPRPVFPGAARNAGLAVARGKYVTFPGSHIELPQGSLAARLEAHARGYAMVTDIVRNGTRTWAGWASYFLDHSEGLPGHGAAELNGAPGHCSYAHLPLLEVGAFPEDLRTGEDTAVNKALVARGYVALRDPAIEIIHHSPCRTPWRLIRHHFRRGRGWGRLLVEEYRDRGHLLNRQVIANRLVRHLPRRLGRIRHNVALADASLGPRYRRSLPLIVIGAAASWLGMWFEVLKPEPGKGLILWGRPYWTIVNIAGPPEGPRIELWRLNFVSRTAQGVVLASSLTVTGAGQDVCTLGYLVRPFTANSSRRDNDPFVALKMCVGNAIGMSIDEVAAGVLSEAQRRHAFRGKAIDEWRLDENLLPQPSDSAFGALGEFALAIRERIGGPKWDRLDKGPSAGGWAP